MTEDEREPGDRMRSWIAFLAFSVGISGVIAATIALKIAAGDSTFGPVDLPAPLVETVCAIDTAVLLP
jgi:hypothetical protein